MQASEINQSQLLPQGTGRGEGWERLQIHNHSGVCVRVCVLSSHTTADLFLKLTIIFLSTDGLWEGENVEEDLLFISKTYFSPLKYEYFTASNGHLLELSSRSWGAGVLEGRFPLLPRAPLFLGTPLPGITHFVSILLLFSSPDSCSYDFPTPPFKAVPTPRPKQTSSPHFSLHPGSQVSL